MKRKNFVIASGSDSPIDNNTNNLTATSQFLFRVYAGHLCSSAVSYFYVEDEVLFSMHSVFRICEIQSIDGNPYLFQIDLTLISDHDKDLRVLTNRIQEEIFPNSKG